MKHCGGCNRELPPSQFSHNTSKCKACRKKMRRKHYAANRDHELSSGKARRLLNNGVYVEDKTNWWRGLHKDAAAIPIIEETEDRGGALDTD